ncbi:MAG: 1-deoxy-D-xylulose-5-phosphate reductoisomerase [Candidatus Cloacimonadota bacterium]|nr:MAG: 1-deoxy-D-xylulose-5-phosphate reductoisomerase [Candidatus Cloacimonadota bacterium]
MKKIAVLGITGSIGESAVEVIRRHSDKFQIVLASAHKNKEKLALLQNEFKFKNQVLTGEEKNGLSGKDILSGKLQEADYDICLNAVAGSAGLEYTAAVLNRGKDLALANKESLVMAGHIIMPLLKKSTGKMIPVDSEHSAIKQALGNETGKSVKKIIITASGGPFKNLLLDEFKNITVEKTLQHPTWDMGAKITVDSATMMNKGLEVIEAHWLFDAPYEKIQAVMHPQSVIHSMVEFTDGSILAQMSTPTMQLPILYAFGYPERIESDLVQTSLFDLPDLTFRRLSKERYPLFYTALEAGKAGGLLPTILNAANEAAVSLFLERKIHFTEIFKLTDKYLNKFSNISNPDLETIIFNNTETYNKVKKDYEKMLKR